MRRSLKRHLIDIHDIRITQCSYRCRNYQQTLSKRPTLHNCPQPDQQPGTISPELRWKCNQCSMSFPSRLGLRNHHVRQHGRAERDLEIRLHLPTPRTRRGTRVTRRQTALSSSTSSSDGELSDHSTTSVATTGVSSITDHSNDHIQPTPPTGSPVRNYKTHPAAVQLSLTPPASSTSIYCDSDSSNAHNSSHQNTPLTEDIPDQPNHDNSYTTHT